MTIAEKITRAKTDVNVVYAAGKRDERDAFWDAFQHNGTRTSYYGAFCNFPREAFYPKYDIKFDGSSATQGTFRTFPDSSSTWPPAEDFDFVERLNECGITVDTSNATSVYQMFYYSCVSTMPTLDFSNVTAQMYETFESCNRLHTVDKIILSNTGTQSFYNIFGNCIKLQNITFEGVIGNSISFAQSTLLSRASIENIVSVLSPTVTGKTLTFSQAAVNNAFSDAEWTALVNTRKNWTFSLV